MILKIIKKSIDFEIQLRYTQSKLGETLTNKQKEGNKMTTKKQEWKSIATIKGMATAQLTYSFQDVSFALEDLSNNGTDLVDEIIQSMMDRIKTIRNITEIAKEKRKEELVSAIQGVLSAVGYGLLIIDFERGKMAENVAESAFHVFIEGYKVARNAILAYTDFESVAEYLDLFGAYLFDFDIFYEDMIETAEESDSVIESLEDLKAELENLRVKFGK